MSARLTASVDNLAGRMDAVAEAFPAPFGGAVIFLSWRGDSSHAVAEALQVILKEHFPTADVFFSPSSIDIGDDPMLEIFEKHLLQAQALVAVITAESASRPWVVWDFATVWSRKDRLVAPLFVDVDPGSIPGPLSLKIEGAKITDKIRVDRALSRIAEVLGVAAPESIAPDAWDKLMEVVAKAVNPVTN